MSLIFTSAAYAQGYSGRVIDMRSPLSQDIMALINRLHPNLQLTDIESVARNVQLVALDYELEPALMLAIMAGEDTYTGYAQARLYYFNLDMGSLADTAIFPVAWFDAERVARAYVAEYERYEDRTSAVAAYFVGSRTLPADGNLASQPQGLIDLVTIVLNNTAEWSHLGERGGPQVVAPTEETPEDSFEMVEYDFSEIEQAYIENMMYFNPNLDDETAREIFNAIREHAEDYPDVDARFVMALVATESSFRPDAESHAGAQGLGQLMPFTAEGFGIENAFDINENIRGTFVYLDRELRRWGTYNYPLDRVLAAYNAGPGAVERYTDPPHNGIPPYNETQNYVPRVINKYFYFLPEEERAEHLLGKTRFVVETNGTVQLAR